MPGAEGRAYQLHLGEMTPETVYQFNSGIVIYPSNSYKGVLQNSVIARGTNLKRLGLRVYKSLNRIDLYFGHNFWSLPEGTLFAAYRKQRHEIKITSN